MLHSNRIFKEKQMLNNSLGWVFDSTFYPVLVAFIFLTYIFLHRSQFQDRKETSGGAGFSFPFSRVKNGSHNVTWKKT